MARYRNAGFHPTYRSITAIQDVGWTTLHRPTIGATRHCAGGREERRPPTQGPGSYAGATSFV